MDHGYLIRRYQCQKYNQIRNTAVEQNPSATIPRSEIIFNVPKNHSPMTDDISQESETTLEDDIIRGDLNYNFYRPKNRKHANKTFKVRQT